jgi:hypothetical protein
VDALLEWIDRAIETMVAAGRTLVVRFGCVQKPLVGEKKRLATDFTLP